MYLDDLLYDIAKTLAYGAKKPATSCSHTCPSSKTSYPTLFEDINWYCPKIKRVTFNKDTTIVFFVDDTYCIVKCSSGDKYDRKTAIAYAIVKRLLGKVGHYDPKTKKFNAKEVDGNGFGCYLQKIVDSGFDQEKEEKLAVERKRTVKAKHLAKQDAEKKAAFNRRVEERAKQILLERAALDRANEIEDSSLARDLDNKTNLGSSSTYVRPDKPFSKFTQAEKREYWRAHNAKRRSSNT